MEVKPGYRQTEVGVIPEDWRKYPLSKISIRITDGEHITPQRTKSGYYLLSARNIQNGRIDVTDVDYVGEAEYLRIRQRCDPEIGDVLISCSGTIGRIATVPKGFECVMVRSAALVKPDHLNFSGLYIQYFLQSEDGQKQIFTSLNQGAQPNLFLNHIQKLYITLPPTLAEQQAIAGALSDADALIESLEQLIAKKRQVKQGAMQELISWKRRLPGFSGERELKRLGEIAEMRSGGTPPTTIAAYYDGDIPWVSITDMTNGGKVIVRTERNLSASGLVNSSAQMFPIGTVLYAMYASIGECSIAGVPLCSSQAILGIHTKPNLDNEFLYYYLSSIKQAIKLMGQQGTQANLNAGMVRAFELRLPPKKEQIAIAGILSDMDAEIATMEEKLAKVRLVKQGMMQELLSGRIRLV